MPEFARRCYPATLRLKELLATSLGPPRLILGILPPLRLRSLRAAGPDHPDLSRPAPDRPGKLPARLVLVPDPVAARLGSRIGLRGPSVRGGRGRTRTSRASSPTFPVGATAQISYGRYHRARWGEASRFLPASGFQVYAERGAAWLEMPERIQWSDPSGTHEERLPLEPTVGDVLNDQFHRLVRKGHSLAPTIHDALEIARLVQELKQSQTAEASRPARDTSRRTARKTHSWVGRPRLRDDLDLENPTVARVSLVLVFVAAVTGLGLLRGDDPRELGDLRRGRLPPGGGALVAHRAAGRDHADGLAPDVLEAPAGARCSGYSIGWDAVRSSTTRSGTRPSCCPWSARGPSGSGSRPSGSRPGGPPALRQPGDGPGRLALRAEPEPDRPRRARDDGAAARGLHHGHALPLLDLPDHRLPALRSGPRRPSAAWRSPASTPRSCSRRSSRSSGGSWPARCGRRSDAGSSSTRAGLPWA